MDLLYMSDWIKEWLERQRKTFNKSEIVVQMGEGFSLVDLRARTLPIGQIL